jgi:hypothetical protein
MLRNGEYLEAENLKIGQSLMPLYFSYHNGYESVMLNSKIKSFVSVYKTVANEVLQDEIENAKVRSKETNIAIHHSDFNKLNNYPSNLKPMGVIEHWNYHANHTDNLSRNNLPINKENYEKMRPSCYPHYETAVKLGVIDKFNHKVKSIEIINLDTTVDVYDLTVDKYNNFYVNAGVVLHNCYRFAYWATQADCKYGVPQTVAPKVRNVRNNKGYVCKHILAILYGKRWVRSAAKAWLDYMRANPDLTEYYIWGKKLKDEEQEELSKPIDTVDNTEGE